MSYKVVHCKQCGAKIGGETFAERMVKLRRHYRDHHPKKWGAPKKKGTAKRRKGE